MIPEIAEMIYRFFMEAMDFFKNQLAIKA